MIFIDSSLIIAACLQQDSHYKDAEKLLTLHSQKDLVITTDIISETLHFLSKCTNSNIVYKIGLVTILGKKFGEIIEPTLKDRLDALEIIKKYGDQQLSFVDALSFIIIHRFKIKNVMSFDSDFNLLKGVRNLAV